MSERGINSLSRQLSRRSFLAFGITGLAVNAISSGRAPLPCQQPGVAPPETVYDDDWSAIRAQFITKPGVIFMNNASIGMPPGVVAQAVARGYEAMSRNPILAKLELSNRIQNRVLPNLAKILGAQAGEIVLTRNASEALHLAATGLILESGDEVLLTTQEHPSGRRPWRYRAARHGIIATEVFIPSPFEDENSVVERIARHITPRTRAIAFCHVTRGGHLYPVQKLVTLARERSIITIVDGAQAIGMMPVNLHELGCDAYAASLHKWMLGPIGTGMLYVRESSRKHFRSVYTEESTPEQPNFEPTGTVDLPLRAALDAALSFIDTIGLEAIERRNRHLSNHLKSRLSRISSVKVLSGPTDKTSAPGSTIFEMKNVDAVTAVKVLAEKKSIYIDEHQRDGHNAIRISTHFYNTVDEIDRVVTALQQL
jgi:selenocysteine lyase/cysteine desulfurase